MDFGKAFEALKKGECVKRLSWENDQFLFFGKEPLTVTWNKPSPADNLLCFKKASRVYNTKWSAKHEDLVAHDWEVLLVDTETGYMLGEDLSIASLETISSNLDLEKNSIVILEEIENHPRTLQNVRIAIRSVLNNLNSLKSKIGTQWKHVKRGSSYTEIGRARLQIATTPPKEDDKLVIYIGEDGKWWARWDQEFEDGRFEKVM